MNFNTDWTMALLNKVRHQVVKKGTSKTSVKQSLVWQLHAQKAKHVHKQMKNNSIEEITYDHNTA